MHDKVLVCVSLRTTWQGFADKFLLPSDKYVCESQATLSCFRKEDAQ